MKYLRNPMIWLTLAFLLLVAVPSLDIAASALFWNQGEGWFLRHHWLLEFVRKGFPPLLIGLMVYVLILAVAGAVLKDVFFGVSGKVASYMFLTLAIGPGLIVNALFKENWGRARPSQILEFGGDGVFTPALFLSDQCVSNCSFSSGHGALGFWAFSLALLAPPLWRRKAILGGLAFGAFVGWVRIAQGGHFLSDVLFSALVVLLVSLALERWLLRAAAAPSAAAGAAIRESASFGN